MLLPAGGCRAMLIQEVHCARSTLPAAQPREGFKLFDQLRLGWLLCDNRSDHDRDGCDISVLLRPDLCSSECLLAAELFIGTGRIRIRKLSLAIPTAMAAVSQQQQAQQHPAPAPGAGIVGSVTANPLDGTPQQFQQSHGYHNPVQSGDQQQQQQQYQTQQSVPPPPTPPANLPQPPPLPPGWYAHWDHGQQKYYFHNFHTGQTTWDIRELHRLFHSIFNMLTLDSWE